MMKIDYKDQNLPMADLLISQGVSFKNDFTKEEREETVKLLQYYLTPDNWPQQAVEIPLKKFILRIDDVDDIGHLYSWLLQQM